MGGAPSHEIHPDRGNSPAIKGWDASQPHDFNQPTTSRRHAPLATHDAKHYASKSQDVSQGSSPRRNASQTTHARHDVNHRTSPRDDSKRHNQPQTKVRHEDIASLASLNPEERDYRIFDYVANSVVGKDVVLDGPFGKRKGEDY